MQGAQKLRSEVPEGLAPQGPHKKVEAQRRRWTFYEVISYHHREHRDTIFQKTKSKRNLLPCSTAGPQDRSLSPRGLATRDLAGIYFNLKKA